MSNFLLFLGYFVLEVLLLIFILYVVFIVLDLPGRVLKYRLNKLRREDLERRRENNENISKQKKLHGKNQG